MILSGFLATLGSAGGGFDVTPNAVNWADISGATPQSNANQTISGIDATISISLGKTGSGILTYDLNGAGFTAYSGAFNVTNGQTLRFQLSGAGTSGTVTVTNDSDGSTTLDTFTYSLTL